LDDSSVPDHVPARFATVADGGLGGVGAAVGVAVDVGALPPPQLRFSIAHKRSAGSTRPHLARRLASSDNLCGPSRCATCLLRIGTKVGSIIVFRAAILTNAARLALAYPHPNGDPTPRPDDCELTRRLTELCWRDGALARRLRDAHQIFRGVLHISQIDERPLPRDSDVGAERQMEHDIDLRRPSVHRECRVRPPSACSAGPR
jgi:hypothetical protein